MGMQMPDVGGQFAGQDQGLAPAADAVAGEIAPEIGEETGARRPVARQPAGAPPTPEDAGGLMVEIFGQIGDGGRDLAMHRVPLPVGRMAHREQMQPESRLLQPEQLLAVVKNNAYGQGLATIGPHLDGVSEVPLIAVVRPQEAYELRRAGVKKPILLMGPASEEELSHMGVTFRMAQEMLPC